MGRVSPTWPGAAERTSPTAGSTRSGSRPSDDEGGDRRYVLPSAAERLVDLSWAPTGQHLLLVSREQRAGPEASAPACAGSLSTVAKPAGATQPARRGRAEQLHLESRRGAGRLPDAGRPAHLPVRARTSLPPAFRYLADLGRDDAGPLPFAPVAWSPDGSAWSTRHPPRTRPAPRSGPSARSRPLALFTAEPNASGRRAARRAPRGSRPAWRGDGSIVALARPNGSGPLVVRAVDPAGETRDQSPLPLEAAPTFAARWDLAPRPGHRRRPQRERLRREPDRLLAGALPSGGGPMSRAGSCPSSWRSRSAPVLLLLVAPPVRAQELPPRRRRSRRRRPRGIRRPRARGARSGYCPTRSSGPPTSSTRCSSACCAASRTRCRGVVNGVLNSALNFITRRRPPAPTQPHGADALGARCATIANAAPGAGRALGRAST